MKKPVFALLSALLLCSCAVASHPDLKKFPFTDDADNPYLVRNGDNYRKSGIGYSYQELTLATDADDIVERLTHGESVLLFLHQDNCPSCSSHHDDLASFFLDSGAAVFGIDFTDVSAGFAIINSLKEKLPYTKSMFPTEMVTPSMFMLKNLEKGYPIEFLSEDTSVDALENFFAERINFTLVYDFTSYSSYSSFIKDYDCLTYLVDGDDSIENAIYPTAFHNDKPLARFNLSKASEQDQASMKSFLGDAKVGLVKGKQAKEKASSSDEAISLINRYYA